MNFKLLRVTVLISKSACKIKSFFMNQLFHLKIHYNKKARINLSFYLTLLKLH